MNFTISASPPVLSSSSLLTLRIFHITPCSSKLLLVLRQHKKMPPNMRGAAPLMKHIILRLTSHLLQRQRRRSGQGAALEHMGAHGALLLLVFAYGGVVHHDQEGVVAVPQTGENVLKERREARDFFQCFAGISRFTPQIFPSVPIAPLNSCRLFVCCRLMQLKSHYARMDAGLRSTSPSAGLVDRYESPQVAGVSESAAGSPAGDSTTHLTPGLTVISVFTCHPRTQRADKQHTERKKTPACCKTYRAPDAGEHVHRFFFVVGFIRCLRHTDRTGTSLSKRHILPHSKNSNGAFLIFPLPPSKFTSLANMYFKKQTAEGALTRGLATFPTEQNIFSVRSKRGVEITTVFDNRGLPEAVVAAHRVDLAK